MNSKFWEFFQGEGEVLSMSRLLGFLAFWPAAYVLVTMPGNDTLITFLGAFVLHYGISKIGDAKVIEAEKKQDR